MKKYTWIVALLLALTMAFIGCPNDGGGDDPDKPVDPVDPVDPGGIVDPIGVTFTQGMLDVWGGGDIVAEGDGTGFTFTYGSGSNASHGNAVAMFKVDLGETKVSDYEKVTFTFTGISGDLGLNTGQYDRGTEKGVNLLAAANKDNLKNFGGNDGDLVKYIVNAYPVPAASGAGINAAGAKIGTDQPATKELELAIAPSSQQAVSTGEVWFSFYLHASAVKWDSASAAATPEEKTSFKITNVSFVPFEAVDVTVDEKEIPGVTAPVLAETPVTAITETAQYAGTVAWKDADGTALEGNFAPSTAYTATITLTAKSGFTFEGVEEDFFTVEGATATNAADSGVVTAVFPATADHLIPLSGVIGGVTAPVTGAAPVTAVTENAQFTGTVAWTYGEGTALTGNFAPGTAYTATITLAPKPGYTITGVMADTFSVAGATSVTNSASSGTVTAVFPATELIVINIAAIGGVNEPVRGHTPATAITETAQYKGTVEWAGELDSEGNFAAETIYTATITLTPKTGYTLTGVAEDFFTVQHATTVTHAANSGIITAVFPETLPEGVDEPVDILAIAGVTAPVVGAEPVTTAPTETDQWTASVVTWKDEYGNAVGAIFDYETKYVATFTLTAKVSLTFDGIEGDFTITGAPAGTIVTFELGDPPTSGTITAVFPATEAEPSATEEVINNPKMRISSGQTHSTWNGTPATSSEYESDGYAGEFVITAGGIRYSWAGMANIDNYDFVTVDYTASGVNSVVYKHYNSSAGSYDPEGTIANGTGTLKYLLKGTTSDGFAIQKWQAGDGAMTITINKLTFSQGIRYNVTLNNDGGTGPATARLVDGTKIELWLPTPTREGFNFTGWYDGTTAIDTSANVTSALEGKTLTAHWAEQVTVTAFTVNFSTAAMRTINTTVTDKTATSYTIENSGNQYNWAIAIFEITLPAGAMLGNYGTVTFNLYGISGDTGFKDFMLLGASGITAGGFDTGNLAVTDSVGNGQNQGDSQSGTAKAMTLNIKETSTLSGTIEVAIWAGMGNNAKYKIENVTFTPR
jgi:uncharacterized repeat protein (TIGR02543 family)